MSLTVRLRHLPRIAIAAVALAGATIAHAQTVSVQSVQANLPDLGTVVSASSGGDTVFRIAPSSGTVTKVSGGGVRLTTGTTRALVTVTCTGGGASACTNNARGTVVITAAGSPTGRARALTSFTVAPGPNPPTMGAVSGLGTGTISFEVRNIPRGATRNFHVGADFGIRDDTAGNTGAATSGFSVTIGASAVSGLGIARVFRPINLAKTSNLAFGRLVRPTSGTTTVAINASTGARTATGGNGALLSGTVSRAAFTVTGEGGQVISVSIPSSFTMAGPNSLVATITSTASGTATLGSVLGGGGTYSFGVGGSIAVMPSTATGGYSGTFNVTVQYN